MWRTLKMAGQMTQTHEIMHTLQRAQGHEKDVEIQKPFKKEPTDTVKKEV